MFDDGISECESSTTLEELRNPHPGNTQAADPNVDVT